MERDRPAKRHNWKAPQLKATGERMVEIEEIAATESMSGVASEKRHSSWLRLQLYRIPLYFRPRFTIWVGLLAFVLGASPLAYFLSQSLTDQSTGRFVEVQVAALITLATFVPVVIALFLQGKPSMRIAGGRAVWWSSLGTATLIYALVLLGTGVVAIVQLAGGLSGNSIWRAIGVGGMFCVIFWLPILIVTVARCSGAQFSSQSARELIASDLRGNPDQKYVEDLKTVIKDLRDAALTEYDEGNRRAVRERLKALTEIVNCGEPSLADSSLQEISHVASRMVRDRELAVEAIDLLVTATDESTESTTTSDLSKNDWELQLRVVSELMSIWADAIESGASPKVEDRCADKSRDLLRKAKQTRLSDRLLEKLKTILAAYSDTTHEESGLIRAFEVFGHQANFPDEYVDQLSRGSEKATQALADLLIAAETPNSARYSRYVLAFARSALINAQGDPPIAKSTRNSLRKLTTQSEEHRMAVAMACHRTMWDIDDLGPKGALIAEVLLMARRDNESGFVNENLDQVTREEATSLLENLQRRSASWSDESYRLSFRSIELVLREKPLTRGEDSRPFENIVRTVLTRAWGSTLQPKSGSERGRDNHTQNLLVHHIRQYADSIPGDDPSLQELSKLLRDRLKKNGWPLLETLSVLDVLSKSQMAENQRHQMFVAHRIVVEAHQEERSLAHSFKDVALDSTSAKRLMLNLSMLLNASNDLKADADEAEAFIDNDGLITVDDVQLALVEIAIAVLLSIREVANEVLLNVSKEDTGASSLIESSNLFAQLEEGQKAEGIHRDFTPLLHSLHIANARLLFRRHDFRDVPDLLSDQFQEDICRALTHLLDPSVTTRRIPPGLLDTTLRSFFFVLERAGSPPTEILETTSQDVAKQIQTNAVLAQTAQAVFPYKKQFNPCFASIVKSLGDLKQGQETTSVKHAVKKDSSNTKDTETRE